MESPASNTTTPSQHAYSWVEEPKQRGTFAILSLCFTTIIICVWSAVHLDIPKTRHSSTHRFLTRVVWMLIALNAPELLLLLAINQRIDAHVLNTRVTKYLQSQPMAKPGILARGFNYILRRAKPDCVST
jgi:Na+/alanine symporter